ncbi:ABC transporter ATP-binding protein [Mesorhizobium sp. ZC-5]|uniref:ABC transporter ATP-binding protein n=1 Tax=Mesorhizobium sp. ZC-5 TaxID=2986066 RepID=UPI0021E7DEE6|nr:ABC transporter ATP-binding protein [Mesorhizobium sp. ZC-5]MCV3241754.1 ABC transporter ATP-binding protein [Mesorhizobium sp. ZC-5]
MDDTATNGATLSRSPAGTSVKTAISIENLTVRYGEFAALKNLSLTVADGELLTVLGPSGSGKSTLLNIVAGSVFADEGRIRFEGLDVTHMPPHKRRIGMVFQRYTLFLNRTVAENIAFPLEIRKTDKDIQKKLVAEALDMVGLTAQASRYPSQISGGQAQRAALARAVVFKPAIMLMDEPLGALDRALRKTLQYEIRSLQQRLRVPMLYVTHDQEEAMSLSDRIVIVRDGKIYADGPPRELYRSPRSTWGANFLGDANCLPTDGVLNHGRVEVADSQLVPVSGQSSGSKKSSVLVRPENLQVSRTSGNNAEFKAEVEWVEYLGPFQKIRLKCFGTELVAQVNGQSGDFAKGEHVFIGWRGEDAILIEQD